MVACGEFSFSRTAPPLGNVSLRVFRFASVEDARAFRQLKYESEQAAPLYRKTEEGSRVVFDSLQVSKRIVFQGRFWLTCGQLGDDDLHIDVLEKGVDLGAVRSHGQ